MGQESQQEHKIYITGSESFIEIPEEIKSFIGKMIMQGYTICVGNESGFDIKMQEFLRGKGYRKVIKAEVGLPENIEKVLYPESDSKWSRIYATEQEGLDNQRVNIQSLIKCCTSALVLWDGSHDIVEATLKALKARNIPTKALRKKGIEMATGGEPAASIFPVEQQEKN